MEKSFWSIFKTFFKVGTLLLGGGYVILPLLTSEIVEKKHWITSDELCEFGRAVYRRAFPNQNCGGGI